MKTKIGVVLVTYNAEDFISACLHSLSQTTPSASQIVVVDNASTDETIAKVTQFPSVTLIKHKKNEGFAKGVNTGITFLRSRCDFFVVLNPDTVVHKELFLHLIQPFSLDNRIGITGPVITYLSSPQKIWFGGGTLHKLFGFTRHNYMDKLLKETSISSQRTDFISGCCMMIKKEIVKEIGMFDDVYGYYFEDVAFCYRAQNHGFVSYLCNKPLIKHILSASTGYPGSNTFSPLKAYYFGRNQLVFIKREARGFQKLCWLLSYFFLTTPYYLVMYTNRQTCIAYLRGLRDGLLF